MSNSIEGHLDGACKSYVLRSNPCSTTMLVKQNESLGQKEKAPGSASYTYASSWKASQERNKSISKQS